ncbi:MAG: ammonium transporter [Sphingomonadales bacterium]
MMRGSTAVLGTLMTLAATPAIAQPIVVADSGDTAWVLASALFGLLASLVGFALFHGRGRSGSTGLALVASTAVATLIFAVFGYSLIFGEGSSVLGGASNIMLGGLSDVVDGATISEGAFALFELVLALFAVSALVSAVAPTARLGWLVPFSGLWLTIVYLPVARWVWAGWIGDLGALDYAGGIAVQTSVGVSALVIALLLRGTLFLEEEANPTFGMMGSALITIGWLALIGGSALGSSADAAIAIVNGLLSASAAVVTGLIITGVQRRSYTPEVAPLHGLAGLAAISAGASLVGVVGAIALGAVAAIVAIGATAFTTSLKLNGGGTAFAIHGAPAIVGALAFPVLMLPAFGGAGFAEGISMGAMLAQQGIAILAVTLWTAVATVIAALMVSMVVPMKRAAA